MINQNKFYNFPYDGYIGEFRPIINNIRDKINAGLVRGYILNEVDISELLMMLNKLDTQMFDVTA